ncbi:cell division protein FtsX [Melioribacter roseus P3M-2]|uniref:Cell division protein FtsX n=1 Tax=Melioribacter roseus (strain DSM 23840 / JCM 17771 / VKM B-2668 / P3M-2) TaxID=1191523 RepID=I7A7U8_MELRP|nr:permease-like cell division protein FtsX [Melioribacter roseus]AFN75931.1 cell division protein FtsX [Melioribacter roseus P3M-2]
MISFYFKEAFKIFKRSPFAAIVIVSITTIAVLMCGFSAGMIYFSSKLADKIKRNIEVSVFVDDYLNDNQVKEIETLLTGISSISNVRFIDKDEAAEEFIRETGEDFREILSENPLPRSFVVKFNPDRINPRNFEKEVERIRKISGVTDVIYDYDFVIKLFNYLGSLQFLIYLFSAALVILSVYLVYTNSRLQIEANSQLYRTMKLVGAKLITLKIPIILYGVLVGIFSSLAALAIVYLLELLLTEILNNINFVKFINVIYLFILLLGISLGLMGGFISSRRLSLQTD